MTISLSSNGVKPKLSPSLFIGLSSENMISFGSGQPDLAPPEQIYTVLNNFREFKYGQIQGELNLRKRVSEKFNTKPENIVITNGASEALDLCLSSIIKNKDKILLTKPYYYSYPKLVEINKGRIIYTCLIENYINLEDVKEKIKYVKAMIINSPANPTGAVQSKQILNGLQEICEDNNVILISDEVYSDLIYEGEHCSPRGDNVITINSFSKTFSLCGYRIGYLYTENKIIDDIIEQKTHKSMNTSLLSQAIALETFNIPKRYIKKNLEIFREKRDLIYNKMINLGLEVNKPQGAFYILPKLENSEKVCWDLFTKYKIITYLGEWFGAPDSLRFSYALDKEKIIKGLDRLSHYLSNL